MRVLNAAPQGTPEELEKEGLALAQYGSCARPVPGEVLGCPRYVTCNMSCKDDGPRNYACRVIKPSALGGGVREVALTCYAALAQKESWSARGGALEIFGGEGSTYVVQGTRRLRGADGKPRPDLDGKSPAHYEPYIEEMVVQPFPRPGQNKALLQSAYQAKVLANARAAVEHARVAAGVGLKQAVPDDFQAIQAQQQKKPEAPAGDAGKGDGSARQR